VSEQVSALAPEWALASESAYLTVSALGRALAWESVSEQARERGLAPERGLESVCPTVPALGLALAREPVSE
jgi:hypothetical protein